MTGPLLPTEAPSERTRGLDTLPTPALVELLAVEQREAVNCVVEQRDRIAEAVERIATRLRSGGRLHYVGSGTSGRLGFLDASECPPTFGVSADLVCAHIAGGREAIAAAVEGAEDDESGGAAEMRGHTASSDVVIGLSASGTAPFVVGALITARAQGAFTIAVTHDARSDLAHVAEYSIFLRTGAEPIAGSTRLRAGTAQKVLLNTMSTAAMVRLNKIYDNLMVDVVATNRKLRRRAVRLVMRLANVDEMRAAELLEDADGRVKVATVMARCGVSAPEARSRLNAVDGSLRATLE